MREASPLTANGYLKTATVQVLVGTTWTDVDTSLYRYYVDSAGGTGFAHGLRYVVGPEAYPGAPGLAADPDVTNALVSVDWDGGSDKATGPARRGLAARQLYLFNIQPLAITS